MTVIKNLGLVKLIHVGVSAPSNTQMIWYDDNPAAKLHKFYNTITGAWETFNGILGKYGLIDISWFDVDGNLIIPHNLGSLNVLVAISDLHYIQKTRYTIEILDINNVKIYTGDIITGYYSIVSIK